MQHNDWWPFISVSGCWPSPITSREKTVGRWWDATMGTGATTTATIRGNTSASTSTGSVGSVLTHQSQSRGRSKSVFLQPVLVRSVTRPVAGVSLARSGGRQQELVRGQARLREGRGGLGVCFVATGGELHQRNSGLVLCWRLDWLCHTGEGDPHRHYESCWVCLLQKEVFFFCCCCCCLREVQQDFTSSASRKQSAHLVWRADTNWGSNEPRVWDAISHVRLCSHLLKSSFFYRAARVPPKPMSWELGEPRVEIRARVHVQTPSQQWARCFRPAFLHDVLDLVRRNPVLAGPQSTLGWVWLPCFQRSSLWTCSHLSCRLAEFLSSCLLAGE